VSQPTIVTKSLPGSPLVSEGGHDFSPGRLAEIACLLEVTSRKPGNVHRGADLPGINFTDFLLSAAAIAGPFDEALPQGVGAMVLAAIESTRRVVSTNTNLGIVLSVAPLAAVPTGVDLAGGALKVVAETTVADARLVYRAIRLAQPGGMGEVADQDLGSEPTLTLGEVMALAAERDLIARQYANGFHEVLCEGLPALRESLLKNQSLETAIVSAYLHLLARHPDSLIARKAGTGASIEVSRRAAEILAAGWPMREESRRLCDDFDAWLRQPHNRYNPGTTADLVTAAVYAGLRDRSISLPARTFFSEQIESGGGTSLSQTVQSKH
jgi:triphosphoribosyl-dephospho-CoA synthase